MRPATEEYSSDFMNRLVNINPSLNNKIYNDYCEFSGIVDLEKSSNKFRLKNGQLSSKIRHVSVTIENYEIVSMAFTTKDDKIVNITISSQSKPTDDIYRASSYIESTYTTDYIDFQCEKRCFTINNVNKFNNLYWNEFDKSISIFENYLMRDVLSVYHLMTGILLNPQESLFWLNLLNSIKDKH